MRYVLVSQLYWFIWLFFSLIGHPYVGMIIGASMVIFLHSLMWKIEFDSWDCYGLFDHKNKL